MAKEMTQKNKGSAHIADRKKMTQTVVARMLIMAALDIIGVCILLSLRRDTMIELSFVNNWLTPLTIVFAVLCVGAAAWQTIAIVKKIDVTQYPFTPAMMLCVTVFCLLSCLLYKRVMGVIIAVASAVATVIFLVYCLYMHIFYR